MASTNGMGLEAWLQVLAVRVGSTCFVLQKSGSLPQS
jgi:hypothetical protein